MTENFNWVDFSKLEKVLSSTEDEIMDHIKWCHAFGIKFEVGQDISKMDTRQQKIHKKLTMMKIMGGRGPNLR